MKIASFDVFDTLVTRTVARPKDIFLGLGQYLFENKLISITVAEFAHLRMQAEREASAQATNDHATFESIYLRLAEHLHWDVAQTKQAQAAALRLEGESIYGIRAMRELLTKQRAQVDQILFISDMYLPPEFIEGFLRREGFYQDGDELFVSAYIGDTKTGKLFDVVRKRYPQVSDWHHWGDNLSADIQSARRHGITPHYVTPSKFSRYESFVVGELAPFYPANNIVMRMGMRVLQKLSLVSKPNPPLQPDSLWRSVMGGSMRKMRLSIAADDPNLGQLEVAANVVGPLFTANMQWVLEDAKQKGLKRLFFVSRDGQVLCRVANALAVAWGYDIECCYFYASRRAFYLAGARADDPKLREHLIGKEKFSISQFCALFHLPENLCLDTLQNAQLINTSTPASSLLTESWLACLTSDEKVKAAMEAFLIPLQAAFGSYLEQQKITQDEPFGFVDIGWGGRGVMNLKRSFKQYGLAEKAQFPVYFFAYMPLAEVSMPEGEFHNFWDSQRYHSLPLSCLNRVLLELFCQADHGMVIGYNKNADGVVEPQLKEQENTKALQWGIKEFHGIVEEFATTFAKGIALESVNKNDVQFTGLELYCLFKSHPAGHEAAGINKSGFSLEAVETEELEISPALSVTKVLDYLWHYRKSPASWWKEGSQARTKDPVLWVYLRLRTLRWKLSKQIHKQ